ncbi:hypothetical protein ACWTQY_27860, partial [Klebsiella pneumoniae]
LFATSTPCCEDVNLINQQQHPLELKISVICFKKALFPPLWLVSLTACYCPARNDRTIPIAGLAGSWFGMTHGK